MIALLLPAYSPLIVAGIMLLLLNYFRRPGNGGIVGQKIRSSDYSAWEEAVKDKREELSSAIDAKPSKNSLRYSPWKQTVARIRSELNELIAEEPKL